MNAQRPYSAASRAVSPVFLLLLAALLALTGLIANFALAAPLIPFVDTGKALALRAELGQISHSRSQRFSTAPLLPTVSPTERNTANGRYVFNRADLTPGGNRNVKNNVRLQNRLQRSPAAASVSSGTTPVPGAVQTFDVFNPPPSFRPLLGYQSAGGTLGNNPQDPPVYASSLTPTNLTPVWSQDETFLVFSSNRDASGNVAADGRFHLWAISVSGGEAFQITTSTGNAGGGEFFPALISSNNTEIAFTSDAQTPGVQNLYAVPFSLGSTAAGSIVNVSDPAFVTSPTNVAGTGFSQVQRPTISPSNANLIVFSALSTTGTNQGHYHLYFLYLTTSGYDPNNNSLPAKLTDGPADDTDPAYSNDGQLLAFASTAAGLTTTGDAFSADPNTSQSFSSVANGTTAASNRSIFLLSGGTQAAAFGTVPTQLQATSGRESAAGTDNFGPAWSYISPNQYTNPAPGYEYLAFARGTNQTSAHDIYYLQVIRAVNTGGESGKSNEGATTPEPASTPIYQIAAGNPYNLSNGSGANYRYDAFFFGGTADNPFPYNSGAPLFGTNPVNTVNDPGTPRDIYRFDRSGNFTYTIPNLTPGAKYSLRLHFSDPKYNQAGKRAFNVFVNGNPNAVLTNFDIVQQAQSNPGQLGGLVTNSSNGQPINGATITVTGYNTGQPITTVPATIHTTGTTANGPDNGSINYSASLAGSPASDAYVVKISAPNFGTESQVVYVASSGFTRSDFTLYPTGAGNSSTISGTVTDPNAGAAPVSGAVVTVGLLNSNNTLVTYATSNPTPSNGRYSVTVPSGPGQYEVTVTPNNQGASNPYQVQTNLATVTAAMTTTTNFSLQSGAAVGIMGGLVSDKTTNNSIAGATITLSTGNTVLAIVQSSGSTISPAAPTGNGKPVNYGTAPGQTATVQELYYPTGTYQETISAQGYTNGTPPSITSQSGNVTIVNTSTPNNQYVEVDASLTNTNPQGGQNTAVVVTLPSNAYFSGPFPASVNYNTPVNAGQITIAFSAVTDVPIVEGIEVISDSNAPTSSGFGGTSGTTANLAPPAVHAIGGNGTATVYFDRPSTGAFTPNYYNIYRVASAHPTTTNSPDTAGSGTEGNVPYVPQATITDTGTNDINNNGDRILAFTDPSVTNATEYYYQVTAVYVPVIVSESGSNAAIKLITENNPPDTTNAYDDIYPSWSPFHSIFSILYSSNRTVTYNVPSTADPTVSVPSETVASIARGGTVVGSAGVPGYTVGANYSGILESQVLNLDPPTLLRFSNTEIVHVQAPGALNGSGNSTDPVNGTATKTGIGTGQKVTFTVRVSSREAGVKNVYIQIKDPDSKYQDSQNLEHKVFAKEGYFNGQANRVSVEGISSGSANNGAGFGGLSLDDGFGALLNNSNLYAHGARGGYYGGTNTPIYIGKSGGGNNPNVHTNADGSTSPFPGDNPNLFIPWGPEYECQFVNANFAASGHPNAPLDTSPADYGIPYYLAGVDDQQAYSALDTTNSATMRRYPAGNSHPAESEWLPLTLVPAAQQDNKGGVLYTATWTTPTSASDYYLDVVAYDNAVFPNFPANTSSYSNHSGNLRIYDNVGGFSTLQNIGSNDILVVSDYALGQKFAGTTFAGSNGNLNLVPKLYGAESYITDVDNNVLPDRIYETYPSDNANTIFNPILAPFSFSNLRYLNGLGVGSYSDYVTQQEGATKDGVPADKSQQYSIWRILARGPVPQTVLTNYLPTKQTQPAVVDLQGPAAYQNIPAATVLDAHKCVIWVSPYTGDLLTDPGALDDPGSFNIPNQPDRQSTQTTLRNFVQSGGRLFISGQDVGSGLTLGGTVNNSTGGFLSDVLNATLASSNGGSTTLVATDNRITGDPSYDSFVGGNYPEIVGSFGSGFFLTTAYPYQNNLVLGSYTQSDGSLDQRATIGLPSGANLLGQIDTLVPQNGATAAMTYNAANGPVAMVYHADNYDPNGTGTLPNGGTGSRVVYGGFGLEGLSADVYGPVAPSGTSYPPIAARNPRQNLLHNIICYLRTGSISGVVTQTAGTGAGAGQGVPGVTVYLVPFSGVAPPTRATFSATTSADGKYTIVGVEPGRYTIVAYKSGYSRAVSNSGVSFSVEGDVNVPGAALTITPLPPGSIAGNVTDTSGNPIPDANVTFTSRDQTVTVRGTTFGGANPATAANPSGSYFLPSVPVTEYDTAVAVGPNNPNGKPEYTSAASAQPPYNTKVTVQANTTTQPVNFVLTPILASVTGHVFDTTIGDTPAGSIAGATVTLTNAGGTVVQTTTTDSSGNYSLTAIPSARTPTTYTVTVSNPNYANNTSTVTLYLGDMLTAQDIGLAPLPVVSGTVTDANTSVGLNSATVTFTPTTGSTGVLATATTHADGTYSITLQPGMYTVVASEPGYVSSSPITPTYHLGDKVTQNFALTPIPPGTISGTVTDDATPANPVAGATVTFTGTNNVSITTTTDANGQYSKSLPPDTYTVTAMFPPQYGTPPAQTITLASGQTQTANFVLTRQLAQISGRIYNMAVGDTAAGAINGATVTLTDGSGATVGSPVTTGADGLYSFAGLSPGTYTVTATKPGYLTTNNTVTVTVTYGDKPTKDIALSSVPPGSVSGTVTDNATPGNPITGATVTLTSTDANGPAPQTKTTDSAGHYAFAMVFPGNYNVTASDAPQYAGSAPQAITVTSGANTTQNLVLTPVPPVVSGQVTDMTTNAGVGGATVTFTPTSGGTALAVTADGSGNYTTGTKLAPGTYTIVASAPRYYSSAPVTLTVAIGDTKSQNFTIGQQGTIGGQVTDVSGSPISGVTITVTDAAGNPVATTPSTLTTGAESSAPDNSGPINYLGTLPAGTYTITASKINFASQTVTGQVVTNSPFTRIDFLMLKSTLGTLGGLVTNSTDSTPLAGASVTVKDATTKAVVTTFITRAATTPAPDGSLPDINYSGTLTQGTYLVTVTKGAQTTPTQTVVVTGGAFTRADFTGSTNGVPALHVFRGGVGLAGLNFLSTPYDYSSVSFDQFFGPLNTAPSGSAPVPANANRSHVAVWNPVLSQYALDPTPPADALRLGVGYWVYLKNAVPVTTQGGTPTGSTVSVALHPAWNQIGVPSTSPISISALTFSNGSGTPLTFAQAVSAQYHLVSPTLYRFDGAGYQPVLQSDSLQPWQAYWIKVFADATILIPTGH